MLQQPVRPRRASRVPPRLSTIARPNEGAARARPDVDGPHNREHTVGPNHVEYRVMNPVSLVPEQDLHFVLCDFGRSGQAYVETDPTEADASTIVRNLLQGQYDRPVRVLALNVEEGWVRDVSDIIAAKVQNMARRDEQGLTAGTRAFIEAYSDPTDEQQMLPLWQ
jgi:hypothetical protein